MRPIFIFAIVVIFLLVAPVSALTKAQLPTSMKTVAPDKISDIRLEVYPLTKMSMEYVESDYSDDIIVAIQQVFGIIPKDPHIAVSSGGKLIALIPSDSKFVELEPHEYCLELQYGTDSWYRCEKRLLDASKIPTTGNQAPDGSFDGKEVVIPKETIVPKETVIIPKETIIIEPTVTVNQTGGNVS